MKKKEMDLETAEKYVIDTDEKRFTLIQTFLEKKPVNIDYLFDATVNRRNFSIQDISEMILSMYDRKVCRQISERKNLKPIC